MVQKNVWKQIGAAFAVSVSVTIVFLVITALFMLKCGLSVGTVEKLMLAGYVLAPAAGGFFLGKKQKQTAADNKRSQHHSDDQKQS